MAYSECREDKAKADDEDQKIAECSEDLGEAVVAESQAVSSLTTRKRFVPLPVNDNGGGSSRYYRRTTENAAVKL